jgi:DNA-directed RNA polymerase specialized sigma24 family protein
MAQTQQIVDTKTLRPAEIAIALKLINEMDFLRLKSIARLHARGLPPDLGWDDLLQEAFTRVISGSRRLPSGVSMVTFLAGVMRSLKSDHWRRRLSESQHSQNLLLDHAHEAPMDLQLSDPQPAIERTLIAQQELQAIERLFAEDSVVLQIIDGLCEGRSAHEIREIMQISSTEYDSARKRMRRVFLREGLTCEST